MSVADLAVRIVAQVDGFKDSMDSVSGQVDKMGKNLQNVSKSMVDTGKKMTVGITLPVVGLAGSLVKTGIEFKAFKQESKQAFSVLLGSAEAAQVHMDRIMAFAKTTPFAFPDLVSANRKLVSFGMTARQTEPVIDAIANATAAMGGGGQEIAELADVFAKITANGKITGQELNRLGDKGINALAIMANKAGVSMEDMRKQISSGAIDSKTAIDWLVDGIMNGTEGIAGQTVAMGGSLEALKDTWGGAMDSLKGAWRNAADEIVSDEMFEKIIEGIRKLTDVIKDLPQLMGPLADTLGEVFISLIDGAVKLVEWFNNLSPGAQQFAVKLGLIVVAAGPMLMALSKGILVFERISKVVKTVTSVVGIAGKAIGLLTNPIGLVILAVVALAGIVYLVIKNWDTIREFFADLWDGVCHIFQTAWEWIKDMFYNYTPLGLVITHWEEIKGFFSGLWDSVKEIFTAAWEGIQTIFYNYTPFGLVISHWEEITSFFSELWESVKEIFSATWEWIKDMFLRYHPLGLVITHWEEIKGFFSELWENVKEIFSGAWDGICNIIQNAITWVRTKYLEQVLFIDSTFNKIKDAIMIPIQTAINFIRTQFNNIVDFLDGVKNKIIGVFDRVKTGVLGIWSGIVTGIKGFINKIIGAMNGMIKGMNKLKWEAPDWVPIIGGKTWGINIPLIPTLHKGTRYFMPPGGRREGLALLERGEKVIPRGESATQHVHHSGTIRVEGVSDEGQLIGVVDILLEQLLREVRS